MILNSPYITGSLTVTGNITASGGITISGSIASSSYAANADKVDNLDSTSFVFTSSYNPDSASVSTRVTRIEGNYATTGSNVFMGAQTVCANITSTGTIIAQTLNVQQVTSSIVYSSGSNIFGNLSTDVQQFTGSVRITGSLSTTGTICSTGNTCFGGMAIVTSCLGIGTTTPSDKLDIDTGTGAVTKGLTIGDYAGGGSSRIKLQYNTSTGVSYLTSTYNPGGGDTATLIFQTAGSNNRMVITRDGYVGIGTTAPGYKLELCGANRVLHLRGCAPTTGVTELGIQGPSMTSVNDSLNLGVGGSNFVNASNNICCQAYVTAGTNLLGLNLRADNGYVIITTGGVASSNERMRITGGGNVGIGTCSPDQLLTLGGAATVQMTLRSSTNTGASEIYFGDSDAVYRGYIGYQHNGDYMTFNTAASERMRITSGGNVLIGTTGSYAALNVNGNAQFGSPTLKTTGTEYIIVGQNSSTGPDDGNSSGIYVNHAVASASPNVKFTYQFRQNDNSGANLYGDLIRATKEAGSNSTYTTFYTNSTTGAGTERMRITSGGAIGIGATSPSNYLYICKNTSDVGVYVESTLKSSNPAYLRLIGINSNDARTQFQIVHRGNHSDSLYTDRIDFSVNNGTSWCERVIRLDFSGNVAICQGNLSVAGSLSKGSGSFRIKHPLLSKKCTHQLVHSFIEGPQADLIYSGRTTLTSGISCINIDCAARMTQGTFEALNRCVRVFTTNESSWDQVKGKVVGNTLVIESQNSESTDDISWMVIGERQDEHMFETEWTDHEGRVITEPEVKES